MYGFYFNVIREMKDNFEDRIDEIDTILATLSDSRLEMTKQIKELAK